MMWFLGSVKAQLRAVWLILAAVQCSPQTAACWLLPLLHFLQLFPAPNCWNSGVPGPDPGQHKPNPLHLPHAWECAHISIRACRACLTVNCYWSPCSTSCTSWVISCFLLRKVLSHTREWTHGGVRRGQGYSFLSVMPFTCSSSTHTHTHRVYGSKPDFSVVGLKVTATLYESNWKFVSTVAKSVLGSLFSVHSLENMFFFFFLNPGKPQSVTETGRVV